MAAKTKLREKVVKLTFMSLSAKRHYHLYDRLSKWCCCHCYAEGRQ
ncbi:MAG: hypothetical protein ACLR6J_11550 [Parabacteroides merdae]